MAQIGAKDIQNAYQQVLGRTPSQSEINSFMQYANNGSVPLTTYDLGQILQGTPEYQNAQLSQYGKQYQQQLQSSNNYTLGLAQNALTSQFAQQGRNIGSSGYINAFAGAAAQLAAQQSQQLAQFYGGGYQNIMGNSMNQGNAAQNNAISQQNSTLGWQRQVALMNMQNNLYQQQLNSQNRAGLTGALKGAGLGIAGAAAGSIFGPAGAMIGSQLASGLGNGLFGGGGAGGAPPSYTTNQQLSGAFTNTNQPNYYNGSMRTG